MRRRSSLRQRSARRASGSPSWSTRGLLMAAGAVLGLGACSTTAGGPEYYEIGLSASNGQGLEGTQACTPMPVMPGAKVARDVSLFGVFGAHVAGDRDVFTVRFVGVVDAKAVAQTVKREALTGGYANSFDVEATSGEHFTVALVSPCRVEP